MAKRGRKPKKKVEPVVEQIIEPLETETYSDAIANESSVDFKEEPADKAELEPEVQTDESTPEPEEERMVTLTVLLDECFMTSNPTIDVEESLVEEKISEIMYKGFEIGRKYKTRVFPGSIKGIRVK